MRHLDDFAAWATSEDPNLARSIERLDDDARAALGQVLARFDCSHDGQLTPKESWFAARIVNLLYRVSGSGLERIARVLDYLDVDENRRIELDELQLAVEIFELFTKADSVNDSLSNKELDMLLAVLDNLDENDNGVLDPKERAALRDALWTPDEFMAEQRATNPALQELIDD